QQEDLTRVDNRRDQAARTQGRDVDGGGRGDRLRRGRARDLAADRRGNKHCLVQGGRGRDCTLGERLPRVGRDPPHTAVDGAHYDLISGGTGRVRVAVRGNVHIEIPVVGAVGDVGGAAVSSVPGIGDRGPT